MAESFPPDVYEFMVDHRNESRRGSAIAVSVVMLVAAYSAVAMRLLARRLGRISLGMEDWLILGSLVPMSALCMLHFVAGYKYNYGKHSLFVTDHRMVRILTMVADIMYLYTVMFVKFSFLALYLRIFSGRKLHKVLMWTGILIIMSTITWTLVLIFQCYPVQKLWFRERDGWCLNVEAAFIVNGTFNIASDVFIFLLPTPMLWHMRLSRERKWSLIGVFLLGGCVCVVSIVRLPYLMKLGSYDPSWDDIGASTLSQVEAGVGILCACLPTYMPLWRRLRGQDPTQRLNSSKRSQWTGHWDDDADDMDIPFVRLSTYQKGDTISNWYVT
ncbi:MAG: hypothetical protein MMC23_000438 [Stictis urceolatum]|nr:hypothetical protein [Stictis urceolata]